MPGQGTTKNENHPHPASPVEGEEFRISDGAEIELRLEVGPDFFSNGLLFTPSLPPAPGPDRWHYRPASYSDEAAD